MFYVEPTPDMDYNVPKRRAEWSGAGESREQKMPRGRIGGSMENNRTEDVRLELAVNTDFAGESTQLEQIKLTLERIAQAGFTHIHWCHEWDREYMYSTYEMQQLREWMDEYGLKSKALHSTKGSAKDVNVREGHYRKDYTSDWEYNRKAGVELIKNRVDLAAALGASEIVLHLYIPYITIQREQEMEGEHSMGEGQAMEEEHSMEEARSKEDFYACVYKSLDELMPYCLEKKVRICIENLFDMPGEYMLEAWDRLFARYPKEFLGLCYDTGHANMIWREQAPEIVGRYGDRLYAVHIHDNNGAMDSHWIPGNGSIQWEKVMETIARSAYQGPLLLELSTHELDQREYLRKAYEAGCRLDSLYRKGRQKS